MSLKTWKAEFMPESAEDASKQGDLAAARHSLRKWRGMLPDGLARHGFEAVGIDEVSARDMVQWPYGERDCALCHRYSIPNDDCGGCPVFVYSGKKCNDDDSQYDRWMMLGNARPMVRLLERIVKDLERNMRQNRSM